jgi:hypothetical protein
MNMTRTSRLAVRVTSTAQRRYPDRLVALAFVLLVIAALASLQGFDRDSRPFVPAVPAPVPAERPAVADAPLITYYIVGSEAQRDAVQRGMAELHSNFSVVLVTSPVEEAALASELQTVVEGGQIRAEIIDLR